MFIHICLNTLSNLLWIAESFKKEWASCELERVFVKIYIEHNNVCRVRLNCTQQYNALFYEMSTLKKKRENKQNLLSIYINKLTSSALILLYIYIITFSFYVNLEWLWKVSEKCTQNTPRHFWLLSLFLTDYPPRVFKNVYERKEFTCIFLCFKT